MNILKRFGDCSRVLINMEKASVVARDFEIVLTLDIYEHQEFLPVCAQYIIG